MVQAAYSNPLVCSSVRFLQCTFRLAGLHSCCSTRSFSQCYFCFSIFYLRTDCCEWSRRWNSGITWYWTNNFDLKNHSRGRSCSLESWELRVLNLLSTVHFAIHFNRTGGIVLGFPQILTDDFFLFDLKDESSFSSSQTNSMSILPLSLIYLNSLNNISQGQFTMEKKTYMSC